MRDPTPASYSIAQTQPSLGSHLNDGMVTNDLQIKIYFSINKNTHAGVYNTNTRRSFAI
jgi:hypothetical protein